nr:hypothetical protein [Mucilaginibacter sp. L294]
MPVPPTLAPKSLNEWTLEQNLVREISELFDTPFGMFYPVRLRNIFDISAFDITRLSRRRTKSYKLTPGEEGRATGGWDASFVIPPAMGRDSRVLYMQIKSGKHSQGNTISGSIFNKSAGDPNPHAAFTFNDNGNPAKGKKANQHDALKNLNDYLQAQGFSEKSVLYAFPRITDLTKFDALDQPLIYYTTFLSHQQMDIEAKTAGADLYDGKEHHFRTCYIDESKREISSEPFRLSGDMDSYGVLGEILMVKLARLWNDYLSHINHRRLRDYLTFALSDTLAVNPFEILGDSHKLFYSNYRNDLSPYFELVQQARLSNENRLFGTDAQSQFSNLRISLFKNVYAFLQELRGRVKIDERVPSIYTNPLNGRNKNDQISPVKLDELNIQAVII